MIYLLPIFSFLVLFSIVVPKIFAYGMFVDGVLYSVIAKNLAHNIGSFWHLHYTKTIYDSFYESTPLVLYLQSLFFKIFGDERYVDRLYSFVVGMIVIFLMNAIWKKIVCESKSIWGVILLYSTCPIIFWVFSNNELELTLTVFALISTYFQYQAIIASKNIHIIVFSAISGISVVLAFLSKGVFGLYPIVFPLFYYVCFKVSKKNFILLNGIHFFVFFLSFLFLYLNESSNVFFKNYFQMQVINSVMGYREIDHPYFQFSYFMIENISVLFFISMVIYFLSFHYCRKICFNKKTTLFLLMGLSASLPMFFSPKNRGWYMIISIPYYTLFFVHVFKNQFVYIYDLVSNQKQLYRALLVVCVFLLALTGFLSFRDYHFIYKNSEYHNDFTRYVFPMKNIGMSYDPKNIEEWEKWNLVANLARDYSIHLTTEQNERYHIYLLNNNNRSYPIPRACKPFFPKKPSHFLVYDCNP